MSNKRRLLLLGLIAAVTIILYLSIGLNARNWDYALSRRLPRILAIVTTGAAIAVSTTIFQTITHNRILTPSVMGLDSLYMLWQTVIVFFFGSGSVLVRNVNLNFVITAVLMVGFTLVIFKFLLRREAGNVFFLLLIGLIVGTLFQSLSSFMQMIIDPNEFTVLQGRMFASFNSVNVNVLTIAVISCGAVLEASIRYFPILDVLALGREQAINLGVAYDKAVWRLLIMVIILVSTATSLVGPITFLGLLVVNLAWQLLATYRHRTIIWGAFLLSIITLVGGQLVVEHVLNFAVPISTLINLIGGIYFIRLLVKEK